MSEQKPSSFMQEFDTAGSIEQVKRAIRAEVLESYRNGQRRAAEISSGHRKFNVSANTADTSSEVLVFFLFA